MTARVRRSATPACLGLSALALLAPSEPRISSVTPATAVGSTLAVTVEGTGFDSRASAVEVLDAAGRKVAERLSISGTRATA